MVGTNSSTGKALSGLDYLFQSIADILSTPLGSRVMLRDYGSRLFDLIDTPVNAFSLIDIYQATVEALRKWQPDFKVANVSVLSSDAGSVTLSLNGVYTPTGLPVTISGIVIS